MVKRPTVGQPKPSPDQWADRITGQDSVDPAQLLANPRNWRIHPEFQQQSLAAVLDRVGFVAPVTVNARTGVLVDGHLRVELARAKGQKLIPVQYVSLSDEEEALVLATLDPLGALAATDREILRGLVADMSDGNDERMAALLANLKHQSIAMNRGLLDSNALPEPRPEPDTKPGDVWRLGPHTLACGDSTSADLLGALFGERRASCIVTDPPYGADYQGGHFYKRQHKLKGDKGDPAKLYREAMTAALPFVRDDAGLYVFFSDQWAEEVLRAAREAGVTKRALIIWQKNAPTFNMARRYHVMHELILYGVKGKHRERWTGPSNEVTIWPADRVPKNDLHPTQKPVALAARAIGNSSRAQDLVFDGFGGSGSTLIACEENERVCITVELEPSYCDTIRDRWEQFTGHAARLVSRASGGVVA